MDIEDYYTRQSNIIKDRLKMFKFLIDDLDHYIRFKREKDEQLSIGNTQKELLNEVIATDNFKRLLLGRERVKFNVDEENKKLNNKLSSEGINEAEVQFYRTLSINTDESVKPEIMNNDNDQKFELNKMAENSSCFGQRSIKTVRVFYKNSNEINKIKGTIHKSMRKEVKSKFVDYVEEHSKPEVNKKFILTHIHSSQEFEQTKNKLNSQSQANKFYNPNVTNFHKRTNSNSEYNKLPPVKTRLNSNSMTFMRRYGRVTNNSKDKNLSKSSSNTNKTNKKAEDSSKFIDSIQINIEDFINSVKFKTNVPPVQPLFLSSNTLYNPKGKLLSASKERNEKIKNMYSKMVGFKNIILEKKINGQHISQTNLNDEDLHSDKELINLINKAISNKKTMGINAFNKMSQTDREKTIVLTGDNFYTQDKKASTFSNDGNSTLSATQNMHYKKHHFRMALNYDYKGVLKK